MHRFSGRLGFIALRTSMQGKLVKQAGDVLDGVSGDEPDDIRLGQDGGESPRQARHLSPLTDRTKSASRW